ncbi:hypothetical protein [Bosea sp. (in: a-proteobacteria)]|uniref:hypothetical protein n=1 Tax=Bosea sp. (in: a-proteobacteria) TaxID=1871050 RepID=UPI0027331D29|nr:hypothetical protein [Bosea sp. (in: a-proteobacteria)]MDP3408238.1 hypothetical protein [Bosea sp. (in: a-proteobacteria)]
MGRRKGERTDRHRDRSHPFQVEMVTPLGSAMSILYRWASAHSHETTGGMQTMRWCFCRPEIADAFATDFGGKRIDLPVDLDYLHIDRPDARELERRALAMRTGIAMMTGGKEAW